MYLVIPMYVAIITYLGKKQNLPINKLCVFTSPTLLLKVKRKIFHYHNLRLWMCLKCAMIQCWSSTAVLICTDLYGNCGCGASGDDLTLYLSLGSSVSAQEWRGEVGAATSSNPNALIFFKSHISWCHLFSGFLIQTRVISVAFLSVGSWQCALFHDTSKILCGRQPAKSYFTSLDVALTEKKHTGSANRAVLRSSNFWDAHGESALEDASADAEETGIPRYASHIRVKNPTETPTNLPDFTKKDKSVRGTEILLTSSNYTTH